MIFEIILIVIAFLWIAAASVFDIKIREVPDWLNFSLIIIALSFRAFFSVLNWDYIYIVQGLFGLVIFYILAHVFYYARIFAGGDAKLLIGLGAVIGFSPEFLVNLKFMILFAVMLIFLGAFYSLFYSLFGLIFSKKNRGKFSKEFKKQFDKKRIFFSLGLILFVLSFVFVVIIDAIDLIILPFIFLLFPLLMYYAWAIDKAIMIKKIPADKLREGDWLYKNVRIQLRKKSKVSFVIKSNYDGLTLKEISLLRKHKKSVLIKGGVPFIPAFLINFIIYVLIYFSYLGYSNWGFWKFLSLSRFGFGF